MHRIPCAVLPARWLAVLALFAVALAGPAAGETLRAVKNADSGQVDILADDRPVLTYNYHAVEPPVGYVERVHAGSRKYAVSRSNYIHPLYGPGGEELTTDWNIDHPHHRGIYWAWPEVQYGGELADLHALQRVFARPTGKIALRNGDGVAEVVAENRWMWNDATPIVRELATIRAGGDGSGGRVVDLRFELTAIADGVTLARRGTQHYGGLNPRLAPVQSLKLTHHADPPEANPQMAWQAATGVWRGGEQPACLAIFEHADNPHYPGDYIEYPNLPWFQATFPKAGVRHSLEKNKPLVLRYRLWIRSGEPPSETELRAQWQSMQTST